MIAKHKSEQPDRGPLGLAGFEDFEELRRWLYYDPETDYGGRSFRNALRLTFDEITAALEIARSVEAAAAAGKAGATASFLVERWNHARRDARLTDTWNERAADLASVISRRFGSAGAALELGALVRPTVDVLNATFNANRQTWAKRVLLASARWSVTDALLWIAAPTQADFLDVLDNEKVRAMARWFGRWFEDPTAPELDFRSAAQTLEIALHGGELDVSCLQDGDHDKPVRIVAADSWRWAGLSLLADFGEKANEPFMGSRCDGSRWGEPDPDGLRYTRLFFKGEQVRVCFPKPDASASVTPAFAPQTEQLTFEDCPEIRLLHEMAAGAESRPTTRIARLLLRHPDLLQEYPPACFKTVSVGEMLASVDKARRKAVLRKECDWKEPFRRDSFSRVIGRRPRQ